MSNDNCFTRRSLLHAAATGAAASLPGWFTQVVAQAATETTRQRSCILLWMSGGPSQLDTFDLKPGTPNGGPSRAINTATPGIQISEHLPELAKQSQRLAIIRSMQTKEGDHARATAHLHTGYLPQASIRFPSLGSLVSNELSDDQADLPGFVSVGPPGPFSQPSLAAGFLGPRHAPLVVANSESAAARPGGNPPANLRVEDLTSPDISPDRWNNRLNLLHEMEQPFLASRPGPGASSHLTAYDRAVRLRSPAATRAFDLSEESDATRDRYGRGAFGQGCLLARRLVERGVPFIEVTLGGWDTHANNFDLVRNLCRTLDPAWSSLLADLQDRGLLDSTLVVWMGEFGRTPVINPRAGRDHYPVAWSVVLGGGGIRGGQTVGRTSASGLAIEDRPVQVPDLMATICVAMGLDPRKQNVSNVSRPIRLADPSGEPVKEVLA
jgi:hypothetical protein